jgi:CheY-like chemotaxis protein
MTREGEAAVLVVDDNPDKLLMARVLLEKAGYRVTTADDGLEAYEAAQHARPLLVVSDVMMPRRLVAFDAVGGRDHAVARLTQKQPHHVQTVGVVVHD